jgi:dihydrofolate reductase
MRKLKLQMQMSVDGYIADPNGKTDWMVWNWGPDWTWDDSLKKYFKDLTASVDCILLSRKMAEEGFIAHWEKVAQKPNDPQFEFAKKITDTRKVVFTKTLEKSNWENTILAKGDLENEVHRLKSQKGRDIIVYGGATFVSSLIRKNLVDELLLFINPVAIGDGMKVFSERTNLRLINTQLYNSGIAVLTYEPLKNKV